MTTDSARFTNVLLLLASVGLAGTVVCAVGWMLASRPVAMDDLAGEDRQRLVEEFFEVSSRAYAPAWFEPQLAYTLRRDAEISAWGDTFRSNELGYRAPPVAKPAGVYRIVAVGDSWTYGMGVSREASFPAQLESLANRMRPKGSPRVEVWALALPGYNTLNELAALEIFFDRLQPDAVVLCPTRNDNDSNFFVLPNGSNRRPTGNFVDRWGHDHALMYRYRFLASYRWRERWRQALASIRDSERWLAEREVPFLLFFVAYWHPAVVHNFVAEAGIQAPYVIVPRELMGSRWLGPPPWRHGKPETYSRYARMIYRGLAQRLDWPALPEDPEIDEYASELFTRPPPGDLSQAFDEAVRNGSRKVPTRFRPGEDRNSCMGALDCTTGLMGRRSTVLLRRIEGARRLEVTLERLEASTRLYPLAFSASIPTAAGGTRVETTVPASEPGHHRFTLDLPPEIAPGEILDVELRAARATLAPDVLAQRSVSVVSLEQLP